MQGDVLLVDLAARRGGAETRVIQLATGLRERGADAQVVCLQGSPLHDLVRRRGLAARAVPYGRRDPRTVLALRRIMSEHPDHAVDSHNTQSHLAVLLAAPARASRWRTVCTVHSDYRVSEPALGPVSAHELVLRAVHAAGARFVAATPSVREALARIGVPGENIKVVWSAVSGPGPTELLSPLGRRRGRQLLGVSDDEVLALAIGRLGPAKDHALLLEALAAAQGRTDRPIRLAIAGDGPLSGRLTRQASALGLLGGPAPALRLLGARDDVTELIQCADVVVLSSATEGLPYVLLEAAVLNTPVLSTAVGSIPQVFSDGVDAALVDPAGITREQLRNRLADLLVGAAAQPERLRGLARAAEQNVTSRLSAVGMVEATADLYRDLPQRRRTA